MSDNIRQPQEINHNSDRTVAGANRTEPWLFQRVVQSAKKSIPRLRGNLISVCRPVSRSLFFRAVAIPVLALFAYQGLWESPRYLSEASVTVQSPDSAVAVDPTMALLAGVSGGAASSDPYLMAAYIHSADMFQYLDETLDLVAHYKGDDVDIIKQFWIGSDQEAIMRFYRKQVQLIVDDQSGVVEIGVLAFTPEFSQLMAVTMIARAEWYINSIGRGLAESQLEFVRGEVTVIDQRLKEAQTALEAFQREYGILDPSAEGVSQQQITFSLEGEISRKQAELTALEAVMSSSSPQVIALKNEISALQNQLRIERDRFGDIQVQQESRASVMAQYTELKLDVELAVQAYTATQVLLERSRVEAYKQLKFLVTVQEPTMPESDTYPRIFYNLVLWFIVLSMLFAVIRVSISVFKEIG